MKLSDEMDKSYEDMVGELFRLLILTAITENKHHDAKLFIGIYSIYNHSKEQRDILEKTIDKNMYLLLKSCKLDITPKERERVIALMEEKMKEEE